MTRYGSVFAGLLAALLVAGCATTTFMISKDGRSYYLGRKSAVLHEMLCASGDLRRILAGTSMPEELKEEFYRYNCTEEISKEKVVSVYAFLTPEEKKDLKSAFRRHGYDINAVHC